MKEMKKTNSKLKKIFIILGAVVLLLLVALATVKIIGVRTILITLGIKSDKKILFLGDSTTSYIEDYEKNPIRPYEYYFTLKQDRETTNVAIPMASFSLIRENNINSEIDSVNLEEYDTAFFLFGVNEVAYSHFVPVHLASLNVASISSIL